MRSRLVIFDAVLDRLVDDEAGDLVDRCLDAGADSAQRLVPIDTGDLQSEIGVIEGAHREGDHIVGTYGVEDSDYWLHVEYGTGIMAAQPYLRPSVDAVRMEARR